MHHTGIIQALNNDFAELDRRARPTLRGWQRRHPVLEGCADLAAVVLAARVVGDPLLAALLSLAADGDGVAARVVLQTMLGRMVQMARRDRAAGIDDYVASLWCCIRRYPLATRPRRIAANLALDALKGVLAERERGSCEATPWPPGEHLEAILERARAGSPPDDEPTGAAVLAAAAGLALVDPPTVQILHAVYLQGLSGRDAAAACGSTPSSVRVRCSRAVRRLARHSEELLDAA